MAPARCLLTIGMLAWLTASAGADTTSFTWRSERDYATADITAFRLMGDPIGAPALPEETILVDVPEGSAFEGLSVSFDEWTSLSREYLPAPIPRPWRTDGEPVVTEPDPAFFAQDVWPSNPVEADGFLWVKGSRKLRLRVRPYRWRGTTWTTNGAGVLEAARGLAVAVDFKRTSAARLMGVVTTPENPRALTIISPPDLREAWEYYAAQRRLARPDWTVDVKGTDAIYSEHPFGSDLPCRTPAESIHAFVRTAAAQGTTHVLLGGMWMDACDLNRELYFATGERLSLSNCVPGVCANPHYDDQCGAVPSDLFYACLDDPSNGVAHPWDANENGVYLETNEVSRCDCVADIAVGRFAPIPFAYGGGEILTQTQIISNYAAKVARAEGDAFAGRERFGLVSGKLVTSAVRGGTSVGRPRKEWTFFDGLPNTWCDRHPEQVTDGEWATREILRTIIASNAPVFGVSSLHADVPLYTPPYRNMTSARTAYFQSDLAYAICRAHGTALTAASSHVTRDRYAQATGLSVFNEFTVPCHAGQIDWTHMVNGVSRVEPSLGVAATASPFGGAVTGIYNTDYGWQSEFAGLSLSDGYSPTLGYLTACRVFQNEGETLGAAYMRVRQKYAADYTLKGIRLFILCEQFFYGDPSVELPRGERTRVLSRTVPEDCACGRAEVVEMGTSSISGTGTLKVMDTLNSVATNLEVSVSGGVGGCIAFPSDAGRLTLTGTGDFYVGAVSNCAEVVLSGAEKIIDLTGAGTNLTSVSVEGTDVDVSTNVLRCTTKSGLEQVGPIRVQDACLRLETAEAFGAGTTPFACVTNGMLVFMASPMLGWTEDAEHLVRPLALCDSRLVVEGAKVLGFGRKKASGEFKPFRLCVAGISALEAVSTNQVPIALVGTNVIELASGAAFTLSASVSDMNAGGLVFLGAGRAIVPGRNALAGYVEVAEGTTLDLHDVPLAVTTLVVRAGACLRIPAMASGRHDLVLGPGALVVEEGARVCDLEGNQLTGTVIAGSFFEGSSLLRWKGGEGCWSDPMGWVNVMTGAVGPWVDGWTAVFDAVAGSCVSNDLPSVSAGGLVFAADTRITGNLLNVGSNEFSVPTNVTVTIAACMGHIGDVVKFGAGCLELQGLQDGLIEGGIRVANGTLAFTDVAAQGVTNLTTAQGTTLALRGHSALTNAWTQRTLATNSLVLAEGESAASLAVGPFIPLRGFTLPAGMRLVVEPRGIQGFAAWNAVIDGFLDYRGVLPLLRGMTEGKGCIRVEGLLSQSTYGAIFGSCRLELAGRDGLFQAYENIDWVNGDGVFIFNGTTLAPTGSLVVTSSAHPKSTTILYVDEGGVCFDVPDGMSLTFGDAEPTYLFGGEGGLVKRGPGRLRFMTVDDLHDGPTHLEEGVYELAMWTTSSDFRVAPGAVLDLSNPQPTPLALTNLVLAADSSVKLCVSPEGYDVIDVRGGVWELPANGTVQMDVVVKPRTLAGDYVIFRADPVDGQGPSGLSWDLRNEGWLRASWLKSADGCVVGVRVHPVATVLLLR